MNQAPIVPVITRQDSGAKLSEFIGFLPYWNATSAFPVYASYFTHIMYFGLTVDSEGGIVKSGTEWNTLSASHFQSLIKGLDKNRTKLSIVIKQFDEEIINKIISDKNASAHLINDLSNLVSQFNLDGINFDFEFDGATQSLDRNKFSSFIEEVSWGLRKEYPEIVLSFDLSGQIIEKERSYDLVRIGKAMDFVIIMGYDYKSSGAAFAGPVAPILGEANDHTISEAVAYVSLKIPTSKIVLGMPLYGYEWETKDSSYKSSTTAEVGVVASFSRVSTLLSKDKTIQVQWDEKAQSPWFVYKDKAQTKQIYFENEKSLMNKLMFAQENKLSGAAFWALGYEGDNEALWKRLSSN